MNFKIGDKVRIDSDEFGNEFASECDRIGIIESICPNDADPYYVKCGDRFHSVFHADEITLYRPTAFKAGDIVEIMSSADSTRLNFDGSFGIVRSQFNATECNVYVFSEGRVLMFDNCELTLVDIKYI